MAKNPTTVQVKFKGLAVKAFTYLFDLLVGRQSVAGRVGRSLGRPARHLEHHGRWLGQARNLVGCHTTDLLVNDLISERAVTVITFQFMTAKSSKMW